MKVIFLGTPEFAVPALNALLNTKWIDLLAICTQPDKPAHRGKNITPPPVKEYAQKFGIEILQTPKISKDEEVKKRIKDLKPDIIITCAFGQILNQEVLDIAPTINVHASLLPKYRGAAPINWAILNGDEETGITIMETELSLDSGPMILQSKIRIESDDTSVTLSKKLSMLGAEALIKALELIKDGKAEKIKQDDLKVTFAPMLKKETGLINWEKSAFEIHNQIRGLQPWPSAYTTYNGSILKIWESKILNGDLKNNEVPMGSILEIGNSIKVKTGKNTLEILKIQPENKKIINSKDWINGARVKVGDKLI